LRAEREGKLISIVRRNCLTIPTRHVEGELSLDRHALRHGLRQSQRGGLLRHGVSAASTMTRLSKPTLLRAYTDLALVVAGTLQLFDDAPSAERKLSSSFPSALRAVCRYIAAVEGADRAEFVKRLLGMLEWVGPDSRKPRFQQLRDGHVHGIAPLRRVHLDVTADEASAGITLLDKFGVLSWFTGGEDFTPRRERLPAPPRRAAAPEHAVDLRARHAPSA
jgi:hypothetical protein